ncbi:GNAT family N-acetyltransferase [Modestobacter sp. SYSU DS0290]
MSTSAEPTAPDAVRLRPLGYDDPVAQQLIERVQQEYVVRYGGRDDAVVDPAEFSPPRGLFLVAEVDGKPAACGGWRVHDAASATVELKRMYVEPGFRRRGLAAFVLAALERSAADTGYRHVVLNSGDRQPEALALYARHGYAPVPGYGIYADSPDAVFLGKRLLDGDLPRGDPADGSGEDAWAS